MALTAEEEYIESGYFAVDDYVGGVADAVVLGTTVYVEEGYIEDGYFLDKGVTFALVCNTDAETHLGSATLVSAVSFAATVSRIRSSDVTLNNIANLNAQADRFRAVDSTQSGVFQLGHPDNGGFASDVLPAVSFTGAADLTSSASISVDALIVKFGDATLDSSASLTSTPIEYQSRFFGSPRPVDFTYYTSSTNDINYTSSAIVNPKGVSLFKNFDNYLTSDPVDLPSEFAIQITTWCDASSSYTYPVTVFTYGNPTDPVLKLELLNSSGTIYWRLQAKYSTGSYAVVQPAFPVSSDQALDQGFPYLGAEWKIVRYTFGTQDRLEVKFVKQRGSGGTITENTSRTTLLTTSLATVSGANRIFRIYRDPNFSGAVDEFSFHDLTGLSGSSAKVAYLNDYGLDSGFAYTTFPNDENTIALHDFNDRITDNTEKTFTDNPSVGAVFSTSATLSGDVQGSATLNTNAGFVITAKATKVGEIELDAVASTTIAGDRIRFSSSTQNSALSIASDAQRIRSSDATLSTQGGFAITAKLTASGETTLDASTTFTSSGTVTRTDSATLNSVFSQTATPIRNRFGDASIASAVTISADADVVKSGSASLDSSFGQTVTAEATKPSSATINALYSTVTVVAKIGSVVVSADAVFSTTATPEYTRGGSAQLDSVGSISATPSITRTDSATCSMVASVDSTINFTATGNSNPSMVASVNTSGDRIRFGTSSQNSVFATTMTPTKISPFAIDMDSAFDLAATPNQIKGVTVELDSVASITPNGGVKYEASATLEGFAAILSVNKVLHVDQYVYVIPSENRTYTIPAEDREYAIIAENRTYVIEG